MLPTRLWRTMVEIFRLPRLSIYLMCESAKENDPFFARITREFYRNARRIHPKYLFVRRMTTGVAVSKLPNTFDEYLARVEASARRNYKKAVREGCTFSRIDVNEHLEDVRGIRGSAEIRQGRKVPAEYLSGDVQRCTDPPSRSSLHDYPYFGVFVGDRLVAYASCLVSGELCLIEHILGHADWLEKSVVPFMIIEIVRYLREHHPRVKYYAYGTYFGAGETMKRFKRKFDFNPHYVKWLLDGPPTVEPNDADPIGKDQKS